MEQQNLSNSVIPQYDSIKNIILHQFYESQYYLTEYVSRPNKNTEIILRKSLYSLSKSLEFKSHVLNKDSQEYLYFYRFVSNPDYFTSYSLNTLYSICHKILDLYGFFKIDSTSYSKENAYQEK